MDWDMNLSDKIIREKINEVNFKTAVIGQRAHAWRCCKLSGRRTNFCCVQMIVVTKE